MDLLKVRTVWSVKVQLKAQASICSGTSMRRAVKFLKVSSVWDKWMHLFQTEAAAGRGSCRETAASKGRCRCLCWGLSANTTSFRMLGSSYWEFHFLCKTRCWCSGVHGKPVRRSISTFPEAQEQPGKARLARFETKTVRFISTSFSLEIIIS